MIKNYYIYSEYKNPKGPLEGINHTVRGGAWNSLSGYLRASARYGFDEAKDFLWDRMSLRDVIQRK